MTISLKTLLAALSDAASSANNALAKDFDTALRELKSGGRLFAPPAPMRIAEMRVSFTAHVTEAEQFEFQKGGDIRLDFSDKDGNFKSEIVLNTYDAEAEVIIADREVASPENDYFK